MLTRRHNCLSFHNRAESQRHTTVSLCKPDLFRADTGDIFDYPSTGLKLLPARQIHNHKCPTNMQALQLHIHCLAYSIPLISHIYIYIHIYMHKNSIKRHVLSPQ